MKMAEEKRHKKGVVRVQVIGEDGKVAADTGEVRQLVVTGGVNFFADHVASATAGPVSCKIAAGTDGTASSVGMTGLVAQYGQDTAPIRSNPSAGVLQLIGGIGPVTEAVTLREFGAFFGPTMFSRKSSGDSPDFSITVGAGQRAVVIWQLWI